MKDNSAESASNPSPGAARRDFIRQAVRVSAGLGTAAGTLFGGVDARTGALGAGGAAAATAASAPLKMAFIQWQPHTVPAAWSKGIEEVLKEQPSIQYKLLDGQNKVEVQVSLMDALISEGTSVIFLQPIDSVALAPSINKAKRAEIPVITLNIDASSEHAAHVEMSHYQGAMEIARVMGERMGGKGEVAILNAPPGIVIRDQRTNGFVDGMKKYHPGVSIVADQVADWSRKKAQDVFATILAGRPTIRGVYGVNDSMALGAVDVAKDKAMVGKLVVFGNDGEKDALESIERGELTGTQYTDVYQQGRFAAAAATVLAQGHVAATAVKQKARLLMPYVIATRENVKEIQPGQRW